MKKLLMLTTLLALASTPARADVMLETMLSGTGDNVTFQSLLGSLAVGTFNGKNQGIVDFTDLSSNPLFTGAASGNDIKITNTSDLKIQVFNTAGTMVLPTATDVFSLKGSGDVKAFVTANEAGGGTKLFTFDLGPLSANAQSGFTLEAINNESINQYALVDTTPGGVITDFEHYRIDIASPLAVPAPALGAGAPGLVAGLLGMLVLGRRRQDRNNASRGVAAYA